MQTATKIIGRIVEPEDQKWAAAILGERELERYAASTNVQSGSGQGGGSSQGGSYQRVKEHTVLPSQLGQIVKVTKRGPRAILTVAGSEFVGLLDWPFQANPNQRKAREKHQARWVLPGYTRPRWGTVPLKVDIPPAIDAPVKKEKDPQQLKQLNIQPAQQIDQPPQQPGEGGGAGEIMGDHMAGQALDALIPGAGMAFEMMKMITEMSGSGGGIAPALSVPRIQIQHEDLAETETDEAESE